ncbi:MAG: ABC transporter substrate-binding protein [Sporichthyaceae bacterium]
MNRLLRRGLAAPVAAVLCLALGACGSRVDGARIVAESGGGTVRLSPESIEALGAATRGASGPQTAPGAGPAARVAVDADPTAVSVADRGPKPAATRQGVLAADRAPAAAPSAAKEQSAAPLAPAAKACPRRLDTIKLGHIGLFSGIAAPLTGSAVPTMAAWARDVNARGGLACHPVKVFTKDDGGDPSRSAALAQELVQREGVVAFVGTFVLSPAGFVPVVEKFKVPAVGGGGGNPAWFSSPWLFPDGASTDDQVIGFIRAGVERGKKKLGVLYCVEAAACTDAMDKIRKGSAKAAGADLVYDAPISITQPDYTAQCLNAQKAGVDQLTLGMDGASMSRLARSCEAIGYRPLISTISGLLGSAQARDETLRSFGIVTTSSAPLWTQTDQRACGTTTDCSSAGHRTWLRTEPPS